MSTPVTVSVIVPVKDDPRIVDCVASLCALARECASLELIVVDNHSGPEFVEVLDRLGDATVVHEPRPGPYAARNAGIAAAGGEAVFFTDADCVVRPGWVSAALSALGAGADIVRGYAGCRVDGPVTSLVQRRYQAHLQTLRAGAPTECDTRSLAVRREVFGALTFNDEYRRVGDTEFGLLAERAGFRVAYAPAMAVDHAHEADLPLFVAKQVCHGWGAQRLIRTHDGLPWHNRHLRATARVSPVIPYVPFRKQAGDAVARAAVRAALPLQRAAATRPAWLTASALTLLDKAAGLAGHLLYAPGDCEPSPSQLLGRAPVRD